MKNNTFVKIFFFSDKKKKYKNYYIHESHNCNNLILLINFSKIYLLYLTDSQII